MKPLRGHTPSRSQTQPVGDEGLTSRSLVGKARGKSPAARSNTGTVAPTHATHANHAAFSYSILDPVAQGHSMGATSYNSATSAHQRVPSGGNKASQSTGLARSPSGGVSKRNHGVEDRFYRNRGHSIGNASRNGSADNAVHPYLVTGQRYEGSVVAQAGSVRGHDTGSLGGSRNPSPYIGSSPLPGGLELPGGLALSASNVAMMNASYSDGNTLAPPISVEGAPSRRGSLSSLGDINGPMDVNDNEYHLDMSLSSQLLVPPSTSPHSPHFVNAFGSPHSPQLEISYLGSPSAHQLPPPSPLELTSGASSPAQVLSPWATHHSSPAFLAVGMEQYGLGLANAGGIDVPQFQDLGHGLLSSSPPFAGAPSQELNALDVEQAPGVSQSSFQNQQWLMNKLAQEDAMMIDSATTGANPRNQNGGMGLGFDPMAGNSSAASAADGFSGIHLIPSPMAAGLQLPAQGTHTPEYAMASLPGQPFNYAAQAPQQQVYDVQNALSFDVNLGAMHTASFNDLSPTSQAVADAEGKLAPHTVPPTPSTGTILPWAGQPGVNLAPGGIQQWQEQQQQVAANQVLQPDVTSNGAQTPNTLLVPPVKVPRPAVARRRSYSTYDQPMPSAPVVSELEPMDDVYLGTDGHLRRKNVSASAGMINAHKRARSFNPPPTINVTNWDSRPSSSSMTMGGHGQPPIPAFVQTTRNLQPSPEHRVPSPSNMNTLYDARQHAQTAMLQSQNGALTLNDVYPPRNPAMVVPSHSTLVSPPLPTSSSSSSSASPTPIKVKQQGQRHEVNEEMLGKAFTAKAEYPNPGLRALLEIVRRSPFYMNETMEPMLGTQEAELLLEQVRMIVPNDPRFASRLSENGEPSGLVGGGNNGSADNASRDAQSIYMLFTESNQCLICGKQTDRSGRALGHVRSDIGHRPYHCTCEKCASSNNPRKFFSENLLDDHLKGQVVKQECQVCHNFFRRGGMRRHMNSKHPGVLYKHSGDEGDDES
ncbi:hypothetical protein FRB91_008571 [Serendipita sp. 411]|nr:hypothetical protein FRB91_008571 [Serendipita sp. 411]